VDARAILAVDFFGRPVATGILLGLDAHIVPWAHVVLDVSGMIF
jgi:hypothetical protein